MPSILHVIASNMETAFIFELGVHACKAHQILHDSSGYLKLLNKMLV
jgi:hypothetical protein